MPMTVQQIRDYITLSLPLFEALSRHTSTKADDVVVAVLKLVNTNDDIARQVAELIGENKPVAV